MPLIYNVIVVGDYSIDLIFTGMPGKPELGWISWRLVLI